MGEPEQRSEAPQGAFASVDRHFNAGQDTMDKGQMSPEELCRRGLEALKRELGVIGMVRFLQQFDRGQGDYAVDRHAWQDQLTVEDVLAQMEQKRREEGQT